jgi:hypothetical protein
MCGKERGIGRERRGLEMYKSSWGSFMRVDVVEGIHTWLL